MFFFTVPICNIRTERLGCFNSMKHKQQVMPDYILNGREKKTTNFYRSIEWHHYDLYLYDFLCAAANKVHSKGFDTFGIQFWGKLNTSQ